MKYSFLGWIVTVSKMQHPIIVPDKSCLCDKVNFEHKRKYGGRLLPEGKFLVVWLVGVFEVCFFQMLLESICSFEGRKKKKENCSTSCWSFRCLYFLCKIFLKWYFDFFFFFFHLWHRNSFLSNVCMCYMHFVSVHCHFSDLRGAVPYFRFCKNEQNQLAGPSLSLLDLAEQGAFISARYETCSLGQWQILMESGPCNLHTGWHGCSPALGPQWKAGLPAMSVVLGSAGGTWAATVLIYPWLPQPFWHLTSRGMKGCPEAVGRQQHHLLCHRRGAFRLRGNTQVGTSQGH